MPDTLPHTVSASRARWAAIGVLVVAMVSVQSGAALAKQLFPLVGARTATALRLTLAALILVAVMRPWRHRLVRGQWRRIAAYGVVLGGMNLAFYLALARIPLGVAVTLEFVGPLAVALGTSHRPRDLVWAFLAVVGLICIVPLDAHGVALDLVGVGFALLAGVCWGLYIILGQRAGAGVPSGVVTAWGMAVAAVVAVPASLWSAAPVTIDATVLGLAFAVAVLSSAVPYSLEMIALQRLPARTFGILMSMEPAIGAILGLLILHEQLLRGQWAGVACVMIASIGSTVSAAAPRAIPPQS